MVLDLRAQDPTDPRLITRVARPARRRRRVAAQVGRAGRDRRRATRWADDRGARRAQGAPQGEPRAQALQRDLEGGSGFLRGGARPPVEEVVPYIEAHRDMSRWAPMGGRADLPDAAGRPLHLLRAQVRPPSARELRDRELGPQLQELWAKNYSVYGRRKLTSAAKRKGLCVGRDQVARLMRRQGIRGASRAKKRFTTHADKSHVRAPGPRQPRLHRDASRRAVGR